MAEYDFRQAILYYKIYSINNYTAQKDLVGQEEESDPMADQASVGEPNLSYCSALGMGTSIS